MKTKREGYSGRTTRRTFVRTIGLTGAGLLLAGNRLLEAQRRSLVKHRPLPRALRHQAQGALPGGTLDPNLIAKYASPLYDLPVMPRLGTVRDKNGGMVDYYEVAFRQFQQQILPMGFPATTVWGYGAAGGVVPAQQGGLFHTPACSFEARWKVPLRVKWINELKNRSTGEYLPPLFAVDQTLHWANPPGGTQHRDSRTDNPEPYTGPVPEVTHLHGGHTDEESDGYPEAWFLPAASNIPSGYATVGSWYDYFKNQFQEKHGVVWDPGTATFQYTNDQRATALWYHAHSLGMTRTNLYSGLAGMYFLRGGPGDDVSGVLPSGPQEMALVIQDRSFNTDGSLFYPDSRAFFDGFTGPYIPASDIAPIWNAETFGNTMLVNGRTWPVLQVQRRRYRFRVLNACNTRFLMLKLDNGMPIWQIGSDGGFLPSAVALDQVLLAPSERADVIVDFSEAHDGTNITLVNLGPDEPFGGGTPGVDFASADPNTTGQVMQFRVVAAAGGDRTTPPSRLGLPKPPSLGAVNNTRQVSFNELDSDVLAGVGPRIGLLGQVDLSNPAAPAGMPMHWMDEPTEKPVVGTTEVWEIYDFTEDAHPFHVHQVEFEVVNREVFDPSLPDFGTVRPPESWETGRKDSLIVYPGEITRIKAHFDLPGRYVWHCHILEHEDNEMMRPYQAVKA